MSQFSFKHRAQCQGGCRLSLSTGNERPVLTYRRLLCTPLSNFIAFSNSQNPFVLSLLYSHLFNVPFVFLYRCFLSLFSPSLFFVTAPFMFMLLVMKLQFQLPSYCLVLIPFPLVFSTVWSPFCFPFSTPSFCPFISFSSYSSM
jgi:hypothetical protein